MSKNHPSHESEIKRINRLIGQLEGIKRMIEDKRYCPDILTQTRAVSSALRGLESSILERHLRHWVSDALAAKNQSQINDKVEELMEIFQKRLRT